MPLQPNYDKRAKDRERAYADLATRAANGPMDAEDVAEWRNQYADVLGVKAGRPPGSDPLTMEDIRRGRYTANELADRHDEMIRVLSGDDAGARMPEPGDVITMEWIRQATPDQLIEVGMDRVTAALEANS